MFSELSLTWISTKPVTAGSRLPEDLESDPLIQFHFLKELPRVPESMPRILYYLYAPIKAVLLAFQLFYVAMFNVAAPEVYMVQVSQTDPWNLFTFPAKETLGAM